MKRGPLLIAAGILVALACFLLAPAAFPRAWLAAAFLLLGWPLGSMALLFIHALTGGRWGEAIRAPLVLGTWSLPLALLALLPVAATLPALYPWLSQPIGNAWYLNLPFLAGRFLVDAVIWLVLAILAVRGRAAPLGLILLAVTATFAAIDLTAALDPRFSSSIYGMLTGAGMVLLALAAAILLAAPTGPARDQLARLLLAVCLLWTYLDFSQFLIVWNSNLASDAPYYARRMHGIWPVFMAVTWIVHAFGAILVLGIPRWRDRALPGFAAAIALLAIPRAWYLVLPGASAAPGLVDLLCMAALAAITAGALPLLARPSPSRAHG